MSDQTSIHDRPCSVTYTTDSHQGSSITVESIDTILNKRYKLINLLSSGKYYYQANAKISGNVEVISNGSFYLLTGNLNLCIQLLIIVCTPLYG